VGAGKKSRPTVLFAPDICQAINSTVLAAIPILHPALERVGKGLQEMKTLLVLLCLAVTATSAHAQDRQADCKFVAGIERRL
jgi:hypothetical protein